MSRRGAPIAVFLILLGSYAYFWHGRDWNISSRLMLTYSLVDRGTVGIDGLEDHTRDRAKIGPHYYSDKQPGFSFLAVPPYALSRLLLGVPSHPLHREGRGFRHWPGDYWATLGTSGLMSAACGALLTALALRIGCGPRRAALVGLAYGLGTPAYVYATLGYGHQAVAFLHLAAFAAIEALPRSRHVGWLAFLAGLSASLAGLVELQSGLVSALLAAYLAWQVLRGGVSPRAILLFTLGAIGPAAALLAYNATAFGSPFDMGYFHEDLPEFRRVHAEDNPLGLRGPNVAILPALLWGEARGLLVHAPILLLSVPGWIALAWKGRWAVLSVSLAACLAVLGVNLSYPEWTGGWSTGPRLLVPMLPFGMLPMAALLALGRREITTLAALLAIAGGCQMTLFQAVGGRIPDPARPIRSADPLAHPFRSVAWPIWKGAPLPPWAEGERFDRTLGDRLFDPSARGMARDWPWVRFVPFLVVQAALIAAAFLWPVRGRPIPERSE